LSKEGAILSVITEYINQIHASKMEREEPLSTEVFYEMFVSLGACGSYLAVQPILLFGRRKPRGFHALVSQQSPFNSVQRFATGILPSQAFRKNAERNRDIILP
jgi:hypothetical protein